MRFTIPEAELHFRASRGGGPGGQHVNKTSTRVDVRWNVASSPSLTEPQRERLLTRLASRVDASGRIRVSASNRRSQRQNRDAAVDRLHEIVNAALAPRKPRKRTQRPRAADDARLRQKREQAEKKTRRRPVHPDD